MFWMGIAAMVELDRPAGRVGDLDLPQGGEELLAVLDVTAVALAASLIHRVLV